MEAMFFMYGLPMLAATNNAATSLIDSITQFLSAVVGWFGTVVDALLTDGGALAALWPLVGLSICFGLMYAGVRIIARFSPGL